MLENLSRASSVIAANEKNVREFSLQLGRWSHGEVYDGPDVKWAYTGVMVLNRVLDARFTDSNAEDRIRRTLAVLRTRGARHLQWIVGPSSRPENLGDRLETFGFTRYYWAGMSCDLSGFIDPFPEPSDLVIVPVNDVSLIRPWSSVVCRGFGFPEQFLDSFSEIFSDLAVNSQVPWQHYLGIVDGVPATACTVYYGSIAVGVYMVATIPEYRKRGLATTIMCRALHDAASKGCSLAVLQATPAGKSVYEKIGFNEDCRMGCYHLKL